MINKTELEEFLQWQRHAKLGGLNRPLFAIDPGAKGAIVGYTLAPGVAQAKLVEVRFSKFEGDTEALVYNLYTLITVFLGSRVVMENVGGYRHGNSAPSAVKFARHCGALEACLLLAHAQGKITYRSVAPQVWMKKLWDKRLSRKKTERKNQIKSDVAPLFPETEVVLDTSDALGMLVYAAVTCV